ncbi:Phenylacetic acid degradation operon negative regulatory protein PaaX [Roseibacterium elongatum DSM 19469]|uniref:Phenylacetic acid degradation operon negative regulatory protein PaaX n=1 Tax=Roseicyclus elongatus DSM 19469 TaxID=1294273 RepID=W8RU03_9RHOB|nr:PaaX family transcriptional regulator C-terminal domain-containing protein [Roseibacterium elongatum]AHM04693.1 Phenylacetic acid degradation operon negative regulatory protein PaaX [Roseibacterium elongatum DSM 19469]
MASDTFDTSGAAATLLSTWVAQPPRAARFIVTIYGDVVVPRGGILWMGTLIEIANAAGLSESLVRTAVSRLVAAGQLIGERVGRRSYYRLTDRARIEFASAERVLFSGQEEAAGWVFFVPENPETPAPEGFAPIGKGLCLGPLRPEQALPPGLVFHSRLAEGASMLPDYAAQYWNLHDVSDAYARMIARFAPLAEMCAVGARLSPRDSLVARLMLVDDFRAAVLRDPRLPGAAMPADWPSRQARALFASLYLALSDTADSYVGTTFRDAAGLLPGATPQSRSRLATLSAQRSLGQTPGLAGR